MSAALEVVLAGVETAASQIRDSLDAATPEQIAGASPLPGWTRAHVAAHIAGFSDGMARQFEFALRDEQIEQYTGGQEGRNAAIEALAARPVEELKAQTSTSLDHLGAAIGAMDERDWARPISFRQGDAFGGARGGLARICDPPR